MDNPSPERHLSESVRERIEQAYYARVNEQAKLENLIRNPLFMEDAAKHPAFYSDMAWCMCAMLPNKSCGLCRPLTGS